jgi:hypothetical protein
MSLGLTELFWRSAERPFLEIKRRIELTSTAMSEQRSAFPRRNCGGDQEA